MADEKYTLEQFLGAVKGSRGIKATIIRRLGCSRKTVDNYLARYATAQQAYDEEIEQVGDIAESLIVDDMIRNRNVDTAKWYAKAKLKHRGYTDKQEIDHRFPDVSQLSDEELRAIVEAKGGGGA